MRIGFTTTIPVEIIYAANHVPVDLNNIFMLDNSLSLVQQAEYNGFPRNICSWIKGLYSVIKNQNIDIIVCVVQGDCSNTHSLMAILKDEAFDVVPFSYPWNRNREGLSNEICSLEKYFNVSRAETLSVKKKIDRIRVKLNLIDKLTWQTNLVTSKENHAWLVSSSDFNSDFVKYELELDSFLSTLNKRKLAEQSIRLGYVGVPTVFDDLYDFIEDKNARIVFNEVQRQFSMFNIEQDIIDQYLNFTYPYDIFFRIKDIKQAIKERRIQGLIAYTQSFCHRQLDLLSLKKHIHIPILQIEGDLPGKIDARIKLRIESFIELISSLKK